MFDPYRKWLGIPTHLRPPTYYQLLGIGDQEDDVEVIEEAALRQIAHVRAYQVGPHAQECTRILNELAQARTVLLNPAKRNAYDAECARRKQATPQGAASRGPTATGSTETGSTETGSTAVRSSKPGFPSAPRSTRRDDDEDIDEDTEDADRDVDARSRKKRKKDKRSIAKSGVFLSVPILLLGLGGVVATIVVAAVVVVVVTRPAPAPVAVVNPPRNDPPRNDPPRNDPPKRDLPKGDLPKADPPNPAIPKADPPKVGVPKVGVPKVGVPKIDLPKANPPVNPPLANPPAVDPANVDLGGAEMIHGESPFKTAPGMTISPDGTRLARWTPRTVEFVDLKTLKAELSTMTTGVPIRYSPDGSLIAVARGTDVWMYPSGGAQQPVVRPLVQAKSPIHDMAISRDNKLLLTGTNGRFTLGPDGRPVIKNNRVEYRDCLVQLWDAATGELLATAEGHEEPVESVAFAADGTLLSVSGQDGLRRWDAAGKPLGRTKVDLLQPRLSADGRLCVGQDRQTIDLLAWSIADDKPVHRVPMKRGFNTLCISGDGRFALTASRSHQQGSPFDDETILWHVPAGIAVRRAELLGSPLALSPDGAAALFGDSEGRIYRWRIDLNKPGPAIPTTAPFELRKPFAKPEAKPEANLPRKVGDVAGALEVFRGGEGAASASVITRSAPACSGRKGRKVSGTLFAVDHGVRAHHWAAARREGTDRAWFTGLSAGIEKVSGPVLTPFHDFSSQSTMRADYAFFNVKVMPPFPAISTPVPSRLTDPFALTSTENDTLSKANPAVFWGKFARISSI